MNKKDRLCIIGFIILLFIWSLIWFLIIINSSQSIDDLIIQERIICEQMILP